MVECQSLFDCRRSGMMPVGNKLLFMLSATIVISFDVEATCICNIEWNNPSKAVRVSWLPAVVWLSEDWHDHGHQSLSFIAYTSATKLSVFVVFETGKCYTVHTLQFWTLLSGFNEYMARQWQMCWRGEKCIFSHGNTGFRINLCFQTE